MSISRFYSADHATSYFHFSRYGVQLWDTGQLGQGRELQCLLLLETFQVAMMLWNYRSGEWMKSLNLRTSNAQRLVWKRFFTGLGTLVGSTLM
jgi:hypothetical protein